MENPPSPGKRERKMTFQIVSEKDTAITKGTFFKPNQCMHIGILCSIGNKKKKYLREKYFHVIKLLYVLLIRC